ncbi:ATP-binding protein [Nocardioides sp. NPDC057577]|uniref:ATP-binding protein n=1 Tax=Nocardioides sp. NPDC057577 TaxID=3346171 RepID=UPI00366BC3C9
MSRNTVRRALALESAPGDRRGTQRTLYDANESAIKRELHRDPEIAVRDLAAALEWEHAASTLAKYAARARTELTAEADSERSEVAASSASPHASLPRFATSFVGRDTEVARLRSLLGEHRLVTITGPGGIGKTRLASHVGREVRRAFPDGVRFVGLAGLLSPELISQAVFEGLGLAGRDQQGETAEEALLEHLSDRHILLILDNCEHLVDACADLVHLLLQGTTNLRVLTTSREVLAVPEEFVFALAPLQVSAAGEERSAAGVGSALALFESRADAVLSGFRIDESNREAVRRVCEHLDGLPLAIELACARLPVLSVADLAERLDHRLDLLTTGNRAAATRHRSLAATLDWSHDLCTSEQRVLWKRASIFTDGFDLAMAEEICTDADFTAARILDAIMALVGKSILIREERAGAVRFRMLETIREYGQGQLDQDESRDLHLRLLDWINDKVSELVAAWPGPDQVRINAWFRANRANLRSSLKWALEAQSDVAVRRTGAEVVSEPWFLWAGGFSVREHRLWLDRAAAAVTDPEGRGRVLATMALVQTLQGDRHGAAVSLDAAHRLATDAGHMETLDFVEHTRGLAAYFAGEADAAEPLLLSALERYREREPRGGLRSALDVHLGMLYAYKGQADESRRHYAEVQERGVTSGERWFRAYAEFGLGAIALAEGDADRAHQMALDGLAMIRDFDDEIGATLILDLLGWVESVRGHGERAAVLIGSASKLWGAFGKQLYGSSHWVQVRERYAAAAEALLGESSYAQLYADGAAKSVSEAIGFALEEVSDRPVPAARTSAGPLTKREQEVANLVAQGLSNKEIAARLVLSPRTIEGHVEHVLQKLCLTSRTQVAQLIGSATGPTAPWPSAG